MTRPITIINDEANRIIFFPKVKILGDPSIEDKMLVIGLQVTAEYLDVNDLGTAVVIDSRQCHIRPTSQAQNQLMVDIDFDVMHWQKQLKIADTAKEAKRREQGFLFSQLGKIKASTRTLYESSWRSRQSKDAAWGERGEYGRSGRFAEKGGQQVASAFQSSTGNEKIKAVYGNYGFWSWLRYWHLDGADFVLLMLMDKGYYDYQKMKPVLRSKQHPFTLRMGQAQRETSHPCRASSGGHCRGEKEKGKMNH